MSLSRKLREIDDAFEWYLQRSVQAAEAFVRETTSAFALIASSPTVWPRFEAGTRRYVLRKFPYSVIYHEIPGGIEVVAVAHHKRQPRYWRRRLDAEPRQLSAWQLSAILVTWVDLI